MVLADAHICEISPDGSTCSGLNSTKWDFVHPTGRIFSIEDTHHHHHHIKPLSIHLLDEGLSIPFPWQFVLGIPLPSNRSPEVIYFIPPSLPGSIPWSATIHASPVCYLACPSIVLNVNYVTSPSPFSCFNDVHDVTNLGFVPYPLVCPMMLPGHTNHCPFHISLSGC